MKKILILAATAFALSACQGYDQDADHGHSHDGDEAHEHDADGSAAPADTATTATTASTEPATTAATMVGEVMEVELGCGQCIYHMEGATACTVAAKIGDKTMLVKGGDVDAHGLCSEPKRAKIAGKIEGDEIIATQVVLLN